MSCKARLGIGWIEEDFQGETPEDIVREVLHWTHWVDQE